MGRRRWQLAKKQKNSSQSGVGGLGGYLTGCLSLAGPEKVYVFVGGAGMNADSSEIGFPDGGGTLTEHKSYYTTVSGTGGCSMSIRSTCESSSLMRGR